MPKSHRTIPVLGAAIALGIGGAGSNALAHGHHHHHHHGGRVSVADTQYLQTAIEGDRFEIAGGKLAQQKGASDAVKAYGARLVQDHTKSLADAAALAHKLGIQVPVAPSPSEQWELQTVAEFSGGAFDERYADLEAKDHQQDIDEAKDEVQDGSNRKVRRSAAEEIPTLKQHLKIAEQLGGEEGTEPLP
jgi:putative membrane protein